MKTPSASIFMFLLASLIGAAGQFLYKSGAETSHGGLLGYVFNPRIAGGAVCYVAVMVLFIAAFKRGGALSTLYPVYATTFVWAALIGAVVYGETIRPVNIIGMAMLVGGMYLMGK